MEQSINEIEINGVKYVKKDTVSQAAQPLDGLPYMMVRTQSAGVFAGYLQSRTGQEAKLLKARRIWYWDGAASLSTLATNGTTKPGSCKFPCEVESVELLNVIEIIPITAKAQKSIQEVKVWEQ